MRRALSVSAFVFQMPGTTEGNWNRAFKMFVQEKIDTLLVCAGSIFRYEA